MSNNLDVLAVMDEVARFHDNGSEAFDSLREARAAVAELIQTLESVVHFSDGFDCYRTSTPLGKALDEWLHAARSAISRVRGAE